MLVHNDTPPAPFSNLDRQLTNAWFSMGTGRDNQSIWYGWIGVGQ